MDTIGANMLTVLLCCYGALLTIGVGMILWRFVSDWWLGRQEIRIERAEAAEKAALLDLISLEDQLDRASRQEEQKRQEMMRQQREAAGPQFYPLLPLGRFPALPPPYESGQPTYPGDLLPDIYPLWEQEFDVTVLAAMRDAGEW